MNKEQLASYLKTLWDSETKITVRDVKGGFDVEIAAMYSCPPGLSLSQLIALSKECGTEDITPKTGHSYGGCETCDYGSEYSFELEIRGVTR